MLARLEAAYGREWRRTLTDRHEAKCLITSRICL
jgi:hypothetical protein